VPRTSTASSWPRSTLPETVPSPIPHRVKEIRECLESLGIRPSRRLGQSFLADPFVADIESALVEVPTGSAVTEVGGGLGILTEALLRKGLTPLRVIERDPRLARHLRSAFGSRIELVEADALVMEFGREAAVVGNLPFSVATPILTRLFEARVPRIVALLQREVGRRYAATAGTPEYGRPSIQAALYGSVESFAPVPASSFEPAPAVDGLLVRFLAREGALPVPSVTRFESEVRQLFSGRRKQLGNLLAALAGGSERAERMAQSAAWPAGWKRMRPGELPPEAYFALSRALAGGEPNVGPSARGRKQFLDPRQSLR
jgi:16S rRNA (adenine1518-N6/adenine1519-N6)-dimethyltransferase